MTNPDTRSLFEDDMAGNTAPVSAAAGAASAGTVPATARVPARGAFWFGWVAQYPDTRLVK